MKKKIETVTIEAVGTSGTTTVSDSAAAGRKFILVASNIPTPCKPNQYNRIP